MENKMELKSEKESNEQRPQISNDVGDRMGVLVGVVPHTPWILAAAELIGSTGKPYRLNPLVSVAR